MGLRRDLELTDEDTLETKAVGMNLMRRTYLSLGRDFPLRWRFYYYKSSGLWRLVDLRVDDRLAGMFDEQDEPRGPEPNGRGLFPGACGQ